MNFSIPAVVVGACSHSLAIIRSLSQEGIETHVIESNPSLPGLKTRYGNIHLVDDINSERLIPKLISIRQQISPLERPVLYVSNDRMVRLIAANIDQITPHYRLGWASTAGVVAELLDKTSIEPRCEASGLHYPKSACLAGLGDVDQAEKYFRWPCIVKPVRPLSGFKVQYLETAEEVREFLSRHIEDLPVLIQEWIPGGDECIYFSAGYFHQGERLATFGGRKLRSFPMGHTTVAEPYRDEEVERCADKFFAKTGISSLASLELKRDSAGRLWVIEPTVGRTDFWLDLCVQNGVNFPFINYLQQTGQPIPKTTQQERVIWINSERDSSALAWLLIHLSLVKSRARTLRFSYFDLKDPKPFFYALQIYVKYFFSRVRRSLSKGLRMSDTQR